MARAAIRVAKAEAVVNLRYWAHRGHNPESSRLHELLALWLFSGCGLGRFPSVDHPLVASERVYRSTKARTHKEPSLSKVNGGLPQNGMPPTLQFDLISV